jgi:hypothetical protein
VTWLTLRAFLEITVAAVVVPQQRSLHHRDGLPDGESLSSVSGRRVGSCGRIFSRFLALSENSMLNVKEVSKYSWENEGIYSNLNKFD